jgi:hypothetical protein
MEMTKRLTDYFLKSSVADDIVEKAVENEREIISFVSSSLSFPPFPVKIVNYDIAPSFRWDSFENGTVICKKSMKE